MRIRQRLLFGFLGVVLIFAIFGAYVSAVWRTINQNLDQLDAIYEETADHSFQELHTVLDLELNLETTRRALHEALLGAPEAEDEINSSLAAFDEGYEELRANLIEEDAAADDPDSAEMLQSLENIEVGHGRFADAIVGIMALVNRDEPDEALVLLSGETERDVAAVGEELEHFEEEVHHHVEELLLSFDDIIHEMEERIGQMQFALILALGAGIFAAFLLGYFTSESISGPIEKLANAASAVEDGSYEIDDLSAITSRSDELGQFARIFERMANEVHAREERLQSQLNALQIDIDYQKSAEQVSQITDTDFFKSLKSQANSMRTNRAV